MMRDDIPSSPLLLKFSVDKVLHLIRENRAKHKVAYDQAVIDYKVAVIAEGEERKRQVLAGESFDTTSTLNKPRSYDEEYALAQFMFEHTTQVDIMLGRKMVEQLMLDKWEWSESFTASNASYAAYHR